jgi:hypothetical protein
MRWGPDAAMPGRSPLIMHFEVNGLWMPGLLCIGSQSLGADAGGASRARRARLAGISERGAAAEVSAGC